MLITRSSPLLALALLVLVTFTTAGCEDLGLNNVDLGLDDFFTSTPSTASSTPDTPVTVVEVPAYTYNSLLAPSAPPAPMEEEEPKPEYPQKQIWIPGYWTFDGSTFNWTPGEFVVRPSPTAIWSPAHWIQHDYGWAFVAGYWQ